MNLRGCAPASLCPPFFLLRGYPSSAKLVLGRPPSSGDSAGLPARRHFFHGEESPCFFILYATCRGVHPRIFAARAITQPAEDSAI